VPKQCSLLFMCLVALLPSWCYAQTYEVYPAPFNSDEADFGGTFSGEYFIFSSSRQKTAITYNEDSLHQFFTDLYITELGAKALWQTPSPLPGRVNTIMNEAQCAISSNGKSMYYTGNLKSALSRKQDKSEKYELGIFHATRYNKEWLEDAEFPFNSPQSTFSCGHPCLAHGDSALFFCSNQPGGHGGSDLYYCVWEDNKWSEPINMGATINTAGNEFFPFFNEYDIFFFTSDSRKDSQGMDIYASAFTNGSFSEPTRLPEPINTKSDDFSYTEKKGSNKGSISSNREKAQDDIYFFTKYEDNYIHCLTNNIPYLCYALSDLNYPEIDSLPFVYEWQFSDGQSEVGQTIDHCFPGFGTFQIALNIKDTLTHRVVMVASNQELTIIEPTDPYIKCSIDWSTSHTTEIELMLPQEHNIDTTSIQWYLNDEKIGNGLHFNYRAIYLGEYLLTARMVTKAAKKSPSKKICIEQTIHINSSDVPPSLSPNKTLILAAHDVIKTPEQLQLIPKYYLSIAKSETPLTLDNKIVSNSMLPLTEMTNQQNFIYVIDEFSNLSQLLEAYIKYQKSGLDVVIEQSRTLENAYQPIRQIQQSQQEVTIEKLISPVITEIHQNVDLDDPHMRAIRYTAAVMSIESNMQLQITSYYNDNNPLKEASISAIKIKQQLDVLLVKPSIINFATEYKQDILPGQHHKLVLQYPNSNRNND
jgi:hypothetical protein